MQNLENPEPRPDTAPPGADRWRRALKGVVEAAFRLHHYRFMRARMLHDALSGSPDDLERPGAAAPASRAENPR